MPEAYIYTYTSQWLKSNTKSYSKQNKSANLIANKKKTQIAINFVHVNGD